MAFGGALNLPHTFVSNPPIKPSSITPLSVASVACQDPWLMDEANTFQGQLFPLRHTWWN